MKPLRIMDEKAVFSDPQQTERSFMAKKMEAECCVILVVDDDEAMRSLLVDELGEFGCYVIQAADGAEAFSQLKHCSPNLVVTDLNMKAGGFEFVKNLKITSPECRVIVVTAFGDARTKGTAQQVGVDGYFDKPVRMSDLMAVVKEVCPYSRCHDVRFNQ